VFSGPVPTPQGRGQISQQLRLCVRELARIAIWECVIRESHQRENLVRPADAHDFAIRVLYDNVGLFPELMDVDEAAASFLPLIRSESRCNSLGISESAKRILVYCTFRL